MLWYKTAADPFPFDPPGAKPVSAPRPGVKETPDVRFRRQDPTTRIIQKIHDMGKQLQAKGLSLDQVADAFDNMDVWSLLQKIAPDVAEQALGPQEEPEAGAMVPGSGEAPEMAVEDVPFDRPTPPGIDPTKLEGAPAAKPVGAPLTPEEERKQRLQLGRESMPGFIG